MNLYSTKRSLKQNELGRLRTRDGVAFSWSTSLPIRTNESIGRCYFEGFTLCNSEFLVGDIVQMGTKYLKPTIYRIVSVFQATKSFQGIWDENWQEIQKRGHPYMELQQYYTGELEHLPDWLLDQALMIEKVSLDSKHIKVKIQEPAIDWDSRLEAYEVCFYKRRKMQAGQFYPHLSLMHHRDSSDDSEDEELQQSEPLERLLIHHQGPFFSNRVPADCTFNWKNALAFTEECMDRAGVSPDLIQEILRPQIDIFIVDEGMEKKCYVDPWLENIKSRFYGFAFHSSQYQVCMELLRGRHPAFTGKMRNDVFFSAPCGFGKSLCFVVSAYALGRITLVVEPLCALISSQIKQLKDIGVNAERLLTQDDAKQQRKLPGASFLHDIANQRSCHAPLIIFSTPEIVKSESCKDAIKRLAKEKLLSLVVIDEFDYVEGCHENFRESYVDLVLSLKETLSQESIQPPDSLALRQETIQSKNFVPIPFLFLSATGSSDLIFEQLNTIVKKVSTPWQKKGVLPVLYQTSNVLPRNHSYRVEQKLSLEQAVRRMSVLLKEFQGSNALSESPFPRCICYCLTLNNCDLAVNEFLKHGITAAVFSSKVDKDFALEGFRSGKVQVLCATSALGRGVHIESPIRFIFHLVLPASLSEYVQATGRGGRDGDVCHCVLFYSPKDIGQVKQVLFRDVGKHKKRLQVMLDNVCKYALEGQECRKYLLAQETISFMLERGALAASNKVNNHGFCSNANMCDNCCFKRGESKFKKVEISAVVRDLLSGVLCHEYTFDVKMIRKSVVSMKVSALPQTCTILDLLIARRKFGKAEYCLLTDLVGYCKRNQDEFRNFILNGHLKFFIQHSNQVDTKSWYDFDHISPELTVKQPSSSLKTPTIWPFIVRYECKRLGLCVEETFATGLPEPLFRACEFLFEKAKHKPAPYIEVLRHLESCNAKSRISVSYRAELQKDGSLTLLEPERAVNRRIYRMYGSDRFLEVSFAPNVTPDGMKKFLSNDVVVGEHGRSFRFFWFKRENGIHAVLFAEKGPGLEYIPVSLLQEQCIPKSSNPEITLGKWVKRMKLNFSDTEVGCKLPPGCVSILDDFNETGVAEIDGAGLVSKEALLAIWKGYNESKGEHSESPCTYSGFQGRLAGFKGIWILDSSLQGFVMLCRKSQLKYNVPMRCLDPELEETNDVYEQIEISSFCRPQVTKLNIRVIQILEYYAELASKSENLENFLMGCLHNTISEFKKISQGCRATLDARIRGGIKRINAQRNDSYDVEILSRMSAANVDFKDPEFHRRCTRWLRNQIISIRNKAHYSLPDSVDVRIYPDHTQLLAENEAFLSIDGETCSAEEIIAMRSPSFFSGDMRRLQLVNKKTIHLRAEKQNVNVSIFDSRNALITSIRGNMAEASKMSGGDYDGDRAWICWNKELLSCLPSSDKFVAQDTSCFSTKTSKLETKLWTECSESDLVEYMMNFRDHHKELGTLCEHLDCFIDLYGFNNEKTRELGKAAFLQVDMPFYPYKSEMDVIYKSPGTWPDWKCSETSSRCPRESQKILGKFYRQMNSEIDALKFNTDEISIPDEIKQFFVRYVEKVKSETLNEIAAKAKCSISLYLLERQKNFCLSTENFFLWQQEYCLHARNEFVRDKLYDPNRIPLVYTAIIYKQCFERGKEEISNACEFAWLICKKELLELFSGKNPVIVSCQKAHCFFRK